MAELDDLHGLPNAMPRSLVDVPTAVRFGLGVGGGLALLETMLVCGARECWIPLVTLLPPIATWFFVGGAAARGERARAAWLLVIGLVTHVCVGFLVAACMGGLQKDAVGIVLAIVAMLIVVTGAPAIPVILGGSLLASKKDFEAGDGMLGLCGAWLALLQAGSLALLGAANERGGSAAIFMLFGCTVGVGALGVAVARAIARRQWCARVARGDLKGWRVRLETSPEELATLPPVFGSARRVSAVVERVEMAGILYRSGLVGRPVAALRLSPALASALTP